METTVPDWLNKLNGPFFTREQCPVDLTDTRVRDAKSNGLILELREGLYVISPDHTDDPPTILETANELLSPSYVTDTTALRLHQAVSKPLDEDHASHRTIHSVTPKSGAHYNTPFGRFVYLNEGTKYPYTAGVIYRGEDLNDPAVASPEKALMDHLMRTGGDRTQGAVDVTLLDKGSLEPGRLVRYADETFSGVSDRINRYLDDLFDKKFDMTRDDARVTESLDDDAPMADTQFFPG